MFLIWGVLLMIFSLLFFIYGVWFLMSFKINVFEYYAVVLGNFEIKFYFLFDWISLLFASVVMFISSMVIIYSHDYMFFEKTKNYFCYMVLLFVGSMVLMIVSPNLLMILLGWDGLGLVSYCLVIYYQNYKSDSAGMITVMMNRVGDVFILLSLILVLNFGSYDFFVFKGMFYVTGFMLIIAGMTKSAQIPFSAWLPAAMAAPTPVSSLVHSSTLVTAGVYLLIRLNLLFSVSHFCKFLLYLALLTMVMSGIGAMLETDLKKIIALSTLSQLGLMMVILSLGKVDLAFFHLLTHALFKAMLFLCAGFMIHSSLGHQDIRFMGIFFLTSPMISGAFCLANMSLFGVPFLSGFYSKDMILEYIYFMESNWVVIYLMILATVFTVMYSLRVMFYSMWKSGVKMVDFSYHWSNWMGIPIFIMGVLVLVFGSMLSWILVFEDGSYIISFPVKLINVLIVFLGCWGVSVLYLGKIGLMNLKKLNFFLGSMWFLSMVSGGATVKTLKMGFFLYKEDNGWLEEIGPQGLYKLNSFLSIIVQWVQMISVKNLLFFFLVCMLLL
uniref:NADH-ubiquinone oxidoreductase chain 5 n=1 Tax=Ornithodoros coriaceus TaxID=92741 RepID=A0A3G2KJX0_ORNCO|nr:NADH dehydrogenase subunit 5 [Ornithodoros coriaceus]AYN59505.1 NADH dehydrogenase subunit 5 [Ornithodoros coriaceus]